MISTTLKTLVTRLVLHRRAKTILLAGAVGFIMGGELPAFAQGGARPSSIQRRVEQLNRQGEQYERDNLGRDLKRKPDKDDHKRARALEAQIRKDLEAVQTGYNRIVLAMAAKKVPADDQILDAVAAINESSIRLKESLALPRPNENTDKALKTDAELGPSKADLMALRKHIYSFVMNPLFEAPAVLDIEQAKRASRELDTIIQISASLIKEKHGTKKASP